MEAVKAGHDLELQQAQHNLLSVVNKKYQSVKDAVYSNFDSVDRLGNNERSVIAENLDLERQNHALKKDIYAKKARLKQLRVELDAEREDLQQKIKQISVYHDVENWQKHYMDLCGNDRNKKDLVSNMKIVDNSMRGIDYPLNNSQLAVTLAIVNNIKKSAFSNMQLWSIPAGHGKSRIIVALIASLSV